MTAAKYGARVVVVDVDVLRELVRDEVTRALREHAPANDASVEYLTADGVGKLLDVHPRTVAKMVARDGLPAHRFGSKLLRFRRCEILAWLEDQAERPGAHESRHRARLRAVS